MNSQVTELPAVSRVELHPYTDLLLHDMGQGLADQRPVFSASGSEFRTAPLWGVGLIRIVNGHTTLLHDGRARSVAEAVLWRGGEAALPDSRLRPCRERIDKRWSHSSKRCKWPRRFGRQDVAANLREAQARCASVTGSKLKNRLRDARALPWFYQQSRAARARRLINALQPGLSSAMETSALILAGSCGNTAFLSR
jgi:hypothetical protein